MTKKILFITCFLLSFSCLAQNKKEQLVGRVVDVATGKGISGVEVQLMSTGSIKVTDMDGKFKFTNAQGFVVGEPNYSFLISKEGYVPVGSTNNRVVFGSGAIENLLMKKDIEQFLWITVIDGKTGNFISDAKVEVKGQVSETNDLGKVRFNFSDFTKRKLNVSVLKDCYKNETVEVSSKGEFYIKLIPTCEKQKKQENESGFNIKKAVQLLENAQKLRNGSFQGQVKAVQFLTANNFDFNAANFDGINLEKIKLSSPKMSGASFKLASLQNAEISGGDLSKAYLDFTDVQNMQLINTNLREAKSFFLSAQKADLRQSDLTGAIFYGADFSEADFTGANLTGTVFAFSNLKGAVFDKSTLVNAGFLGSILDQTSFVDAKIENTMINGSVATDSIIPFSKEQLQSLCKYANDETMASSILWADEHYYFELMTKRKSPQSPTGYRHEEIYKSEDYFANFLGDTFSVCKPIKDHRSFGVKVFAVDDEVLRKNNRFSYVREIVDAHRMLLRKSLQPRFTIRDVEERDQWLLRQKKKMNEFKTPKIPIVNENILLLLMKKNGMIQDSYPYWRTFTHSFLYRTSAVEIQRQLTMSQSSVQTIKVPSISKFNRAPETIVTAYKEMIDEKYQTPIKEVYTPEIKKRMKRVRNSDKIKFYFKEDSIFSYSDYLKLGNSMLGFRGLKKPFRELGFVFSSPERYIAMKRPVGLTSATIVFRFQVEITKVELKEISERSYLLLYVNPLALQYKDDAQQWKTVEEYEFVMR